MLSVKSFQSCLTLCDPMDCNLPGSSVHGILQARILEWLAISLSTKMNRGRLRKKFSSDLEVFFNLKKEKGGGRERDRDPQKSSQKLWRDLSCFMNSTGTLSSIFV